MKLNYLGSYFLKHLVVENKLKLNTFYSLKIILVSLLFFNTPKATSQCANYQVYESFGTSIPTSGGTWTDNSITYSTVTTANSGGNQLELNAVGDFIRTPLISTPGIFSFFQKRSGVAGGTPKFTVQTSPDGVTWTPRGSVTPGIAWVKYSVNLGALGLTNVYVQIIDERAFGVELRYIDDVAWTSTVAAENTFIPAIANCSQTITCGTTYSFTDQGGINDTYNTNKDYTITFTPSIGTNKVELVFNSFNTESGEDGIIFYNGPTTASPIIPSGLPAGTNATNCPANSYYGTNSPGTITSTDASGAITVRFRSSSAINNSGWIAGVSCISPSTCQKPTLAATTLITSNSATLNWVAPSPAPSNGYEYVISTSNTTPVGSGTFVAGITANVSSLISNTIYYVFVRSDCGAGVFSGWTSSGTFTTLLGPCIVPISQATSFLTGTITSSTFPASFSGSANGYLVIQSTSATPPTQPSNGTLYNAGNIATLGAGLTFIQSGATTSFTATSLAGNTQYYFYIFNYNNTSCTGGPAYNLSGPLTGNGITCPAIPNTVGTASLTPSGFTLNWTAPTGGAAAAITYSIQITTDVGYTANIAGSPFTIVAPIVTLNVTGLATNTIYYYRILASNSCSSAYVSSNVTTLFPPCVAPASQANSFLLGSVTSSSVPASFSGTANGYLVVRSLTNTPPSQPVNGTTYNAGNVATLGAAFSFVQSGASLGIAGTGLASSTQYYYFIYAYNNTTCSGGPIYYLSSPLTGTGTTLAAFNDDCSTAIPLTVGINCIMSAFSNASATASSTTGTPAPGCGSYLGGDVWFSAVVPANGILILDSQVGTMTDSGMALYSGSCGALTLIECDDDDSSNGLMSYINRTGLTPGSTVYIRFWEFSNDNNGTFGICASTLSSCQPPTLSDTTNITNTTATINWAAPVIVPSTGYEYIVSTSNTTPVISGVATIALTVNLTGLTANTTYYIFVRSNCGGTFSAWSTAGTFQTGYCVSTSTSTTSYINNFSTTGGITNITNNGSGFSATGYGNFIALSVSQQPYGTVNFSSAYVGGTFGFNIWIDWNNDLDFNDSGEKVYGSGNFFASDTGSFTVPATANVGSHRMRIRANWSDSNPLACGSITTGETEDYTFTVVALPCSGYPTNLPATSIAFTTAIINWTAASPAPANGYEYIYSSSATAPVPATLISGSTAAGVTSANLTGLTSGSIYYVWVRANCGVNKGVWVGPISFITNAAPPVTTNASICQGGSATLTATGSCTNLTNLGATINGAWDALGDPRAIRPLIFIANSPICQFDGAGLTSNYTSLDFQVSATGFYVFTMAPTTAYDSMGYIVINPFNPGVCGSGTWVVGDDDSGPTTFEPMMSTTLTAGVTYTLISTLYSGSSITLTNTYQWNVSGPGTISGVVGGTVEWYTGPIGGVPIGTGTPFNPVGVSGSGLTNTNTPGTYPFYAACPNNPTVRSLANFVINGPTSVISGSGSTCSASVPMSIALTGTSPWTFTYTNGITPVTVVGNITNPYVFNVTPTVPATYTVTALSDATCTASLSSMTGTGTINASKSWNGATTDWNTASNWNPVGIPTALDCVVIGNTAIDPIISGASYNAYAYSLTVLNGGVLQVNATNTISVTDVVTVVSGGQFNLLNSASLVQVNNVANSGVINIERITQPMYRFDFTFWGCPITFASNFTLGNLSPLTLSDKYFSWIPTVANGFGNWQSETAATIMNPIKGYIVRAPQTYSYTPTVFVPYTANFIGTPNNGNISCPIYHGTLGAGTNNDKYNLLGNPYPSAVDAQAFLTDPANIPVIDGTIYFWTHNSAPSTTYVDPFYGDFVINYTESDYASWNSLGAIGSRGSAALSGGVVPNGIIGTGQGFFTKSTGTAPSGNPAIFKNSMRVTGNNNQFFRLNSNTNNETATLEKHRIWLNLISVSGSFNQILVGYVDGATNGWDRTYDGTRIGLGTGNSFYSVLHDKDLVIQGRPTPFSEYDAVRLGYKSTLREAFSLRLDHFDGLFENQEIYVEDKELNVIHNLKESPYNFRSGIGTYNRRFVLRFTDSNGETRVLSDTLEPNVNAIIEQRNLVIEASQNIITVDIYDVSGKLIGSDSLVEMSRNYSSNFLYAEGVYLIKIKLENGYIATKKLIHKRNP